MVKNIFKRIIVGVGIALVLMLIKGNLLTVVNAQISSIGSGTVAECTNCSVLNYNSGNSWSGWKQGTLYFNFAIYDQNATNPQYNWTLVPSNVYVVASGTGYSCNVVGVSNPRELEPVINNGSTSGNAYINALMTSRYSATCKVAPGSSGINSIHVIGMGNSGTAGMQLYGPITFTDDSDNNNVIDAINNSNQSVINNQNQNTQDSIKSQEVCNKEVIDKNDGITNGYLNSSGNVSSASSYVVTDYINIEKVKSLVLKAQNTNASSRFCFYNDSKTLISCDQPSNYNVDSNINIPSNSSYVRFSINSSSNIPSFYLEYCKNGNQAIVDSNKKLNDTLNNNDVSSGTSDTLNGLLEESSSNDTYGPVADLLLLPLNFYRAFYNSFNGTCSSFNLGSLLGTNITFPCINLQQLLGSTLYNLIDLAICLFMTYNIVLMCIDIFDRITSLEDPFNELYSPKHVYHPKHGGGN